MKTFRDMLVTNAISYPDKTAFIFKGRKYTFSEVNSRVNSIINALSKMGVKKGDHVGILAYNCPQYFEAFALSKAGIVCVPLNFRSVARELVYLINNSEINTIIVAKEFIDLANSVRNEIKGIKNFLSLNCDADGMKNYEDIIKTHASVELTDTLSPDDDAAIYYTSGTTGRPKGAVHTHKSLLAEINMPNKDLTPEDVALCVMPFFHVGGSAAYQFAVFKSGAASVVLEKFDEVDVLEAIENEKVTYVNMVPAMIIRLMDHPDLNKYDLRSLKTIGFTGAPLPVDVMRRCNAYFGPIIHQELGQTETLNLTRFKKHEYKIDGSAKDIKRLESAGKPAVLGELIIMDDKGNEVPRGQVGEIVSRSDRNMRGYWNMPDATAETIREGWLHTGDLGRMDEDGFIFIVDRKKDMIISGGENIYSQEVEDVLYSHPAVLYAAVIGVPDERWGEAVKAILVLRDGMKATEGEIIDYCKENLAGYKKPKSVEFRDSMPMTGSGKIQKNIIREPYWKGHEKMVH
ncbi:MAG: long-chain-fatty-acid--CoA ligase [Deltaproteobacteria bacterium]|nr:long-chain-fatty-acid--CoA ligase [Deltaproteobacteria bacterium]